MLINAYCDGVQVTYFVNSLEELDAIDEDDNDDGVDAKVLVQGLPFLRMFSCRSLRMGLCSFYKNDQTALGRDSHRRRKLLGQLSLSIALAQIYRGYSYHSLLRCP